MSSWFDAQRFETLRLAQGVTWGRPVRVLDSTTSTNDLALAAVAGDAKTGIVWVAAEQTRGRGRRGNAWVASPGSALLTSVLLRWPAPTQTVNGLSLAVGLAALRACQPRVPDAELRLKWPNDVVTSRGEKLAGVLVETRTMASGGVGVVLGVGINARGQNLPSEAGRAISLEQLGADDAARELEGLLATLLGELEKVVPRVLTAGLGGLLDDIRPLDALCGRTVTVSDAGTPAGPLGISGMGAPVSGVAQGIDAEGLLLVETSAGVRRVQGGHVDWTP